MVCCVSWIKHRSLVLCCYCPVEHVINGVVTWRVVYGWRHKLCVQEIKYALCGLFYRYTTIVMNILKNRSLLHAKVFILEHMKITCINRTFTWSMNFEDTILALAVTDVARCIFGVATRSPFAPLPLLISSLRHRLGNISCVTYHPESFPTNTP